MKEKRKMNDISANMVCMFYEFLIDFVRYLWGKREHRVIQFYSICPLFLEPTGFLSCQESRWRSSLILPFTNIINLRNPISNGDLVKEMDKLMKNG
jgi:hypothetical protein